MGLVGPNGCGKSTMLGIVSGLVKPDDGTVVFDGEPLPLGQYRKIQDRGVRLVAQELALAPQDTVWESVMLGSEPRTARGHQPATRAPRRGGRDRAARPRAAAQRPGLDASRPWSGGWSPSRAAPHIRTPAC